MTKNREQKNKETLFKTGKDKVIMRFTDRDRRLLFWINGHGFATVEQIARWMKVTPAFSYSRVKKLINAGFLNRQRILHNSKRIHTISKQGKQAIGDELPIQKKLNLGSYIHDVKLIDLSLDLIDAHGGSFMPERRIRQLKGLSGVGSVGHIPDGILELETENKIAIELELTVKSKERLSKIMNEYAANLEFKEIWYFVEEDMVKSAISKAAEKAGVYNLQIKENVNEGS